MIEDPDAGEEEDAWVIETAGFAVADTAVVTEEGVNKLLYLRLDGTEGEEVEFVMHFEDVAHLVNYLIQHVNNFDPNLLAKVMYASTEADSTDPR